jgi:hypothetical protein
LLTGDLYAFHTARDYQLTRAVEVGRHHYFRNAGADIDHFIVFQAQHGGHGGRLPLTGRLHGPCSFGYQSQAILKRQHLIGYQGRELSQGVARHHVGFKIGQNGRLGN